MLAGLPARFGRPAPLAVGSAAVAVGALIVIAYAVLLHQSGVAAPTVPLLSVLLAAALSSVAGFAFASVCGAMLLHMMSDQIQVVEIIMVCSIANQTLGSAVLRRHIDWRTLPVFLLGGFAGVPLGVGLLLHLGQGGFQEAIGGLTAAYAAYALLKRPVTIARGGQAADLCVGFLGGVTGGIAGFPSAPVTIWCGLKGWSKQCQRGLYQPFILIMQILSLSLIQIMPRHAAPDRAFDCGALAYVPVSLLGTWFGLKIFGHMSDRTFALSVNLLLLVSGVGLML